MQTSLHKLFPFAFRRTAAVTALATMISVPALEAAVLSWDITPGTVGAGNGSITGGTGTWDTVATSGTWTADNGVTNVAWVNNTTPDSAIFGDVAGTVTLGTGIRANTLTFNTPGYIITGNTLTLAGTTPTINAESDATISSIVAGTDGLTKTGAGVLTLSGTNTYTGGTRVKGGTLVVSADNNLGGTGVNNPITLDGGILSTGTANVALNANHPLTIGAAGGTLNGSVGNLVNFSGLAANKLLGSGTLTITGTGSTNTVLQIIGAQTLFTGDIHIDSARINLNNSAATLGSGAVTIAGGSASLYASATVNLANQFTIQSTGGENRGAIRLSGGGTLSGPIILAGDASIHSDGVGTTTTLSNNITGNFALGLGTGTAGNATNKYVLTGTNTQTSTTVFGILNINADAALGAASGKLTFNGNSTLQAGAPTITLNASREVEVLGNTTFDTNGNGISVAGPVTGIGSVTKSKPGTLTLSGANTYSGATTLAGGVLVLDYTTQDNSKLSDFSELALAGGTLRLNGGTHSETVGFTTVSGATSIIATGTSRINLGQITRTEGGSLNLSASGIATTDSTNDTTGILGGWAIINGTDWAVNSTNQPGGSIAAYTGYTNVPLGGTIANGANANVRLSGGTSGNVLLGATVTNINTLAQNQTTPTTLDTAAKTLRLGTVGGILVPEGKGALTIGTAPNSGTLTAGGNAADQPGEISVTTNSANAVTINSIIANNGTGLVSLTKSGTGTLVLTATNTYTGSTAIHGGTLEIGGAGSLGTTYDAGIVNNGSLVYNTSVSSTLGGVISGTGSVTKSGTSTLTLTGANTYSGGTNLTSGTLNVNNVTALSTGLLTINGGTLDNTSGAALTLTRNNPQNWNGDFTFQGTQGLNLGTGAVTMNGNRTVTVTGSTLSVGGISGTGFSLSKEGAGTLVINGASTYTGGTAINKGTLQVSAANALPTTGTTTIGPDGTLSLQSNGSITFASPLSGTGRVLLTTSGTAGDTRLSGVSTGFTGTLELSGSGGNKLNAGGLQIGPSALIKINSGAQLFTASTNLANPIEVIGTGNTENRGGIRLNNSTLFGPIKLLGDTTIGGEGGSITGTITGTAAAAATQTLILGTSNSNVGGTYNGVISDGTGGGKLAVTIATGVNNLGGNNTYSGATTVSGTSTLNLTGSIPNSALTMAGGTTLRGEGTAASLTTTGATNLTVDPSTAGAFTSTGILTLGANVNVTLSGATIPSAPFTVLNHGGTSATAANFTLANSANFRAPAFTVGATNVTLALGNTNLTWTGVGGSTWNVNSTANWKDAASTPQKFFFADAVTFNDTPGIDQTVTLGNAVQPGAITVDNSTIAYSIVANGSNVVAGGSLLKTGTNVLTMAGNVANSFTGGTTIQGGTVNIEHGSSLGTGQIKIEPNGALAAGADNLSIANAMTLNGGTIDASSRIVTNSTNLNGVISGTGNFTIASSGDTSATGGGKVGVGVRFNNAANTFTGDITVTSGLFSYQTNAALGNPANKIILNGGGLLDNGTGVNLTHDIVVGAGGGLFRTYGSTVATLSGALSGAGDFRHTDGGKLILAGDLSGFTGTYDNQFGTTVVTGDKASGGSWMISGGTLRYEGAGAQAWKDVTGSGNLEVTAGTLTLNGEDFYTGVTNVSGGQLVLSGSVEGSLRANVTGGELRLAASNRMSDFATLNLGGGTFNTGGFSETLGSLSLTADSTIDFGNGNSLLTFGFGSILDAGRTLRITNWSGSTAGGGTDQLIFQEDMSAWLGQFTFNGFTGAAQIDHTATGGGYEIVAVPEPSSLLLLGAAVGLFGFRRRKRSSR